jgi:alpha-tubulin suppressor-like RCC1 family protein
MTCYRVPGAVPGQLTFGLAIAAAVLLAACNERVVVPPADEPDSVLAGLVVSEPQSVAGSAAAAVAATTSEHGSAFVSMEPGALPQAVSVEIRNVTTGGPPSDPIPVYEGGFDPIAVPASAGDRLEIAVLEIGGAVRYLIATVPVRRPPVVVRTNPPRGRTDVALSLILEVVFSEPIDPGTLDGAVQLQRDGSVVSASVQRLPGSPFVVQLEPAGPLAPETGYELVVTAAVRDLDGDALEEQVRVAFTTAASGTFSIVQISAGWGHTCAVTLDGTGYCWGVNLYGSLGTGTQYVGSNSGTPRAVAGGLSFAQVTAGGSRTCGVTGDGQAYCWGWNIDGTLGDGTEVDRAVPTPVAGGLRFAQVSTGKALVSAHTSAVTPDDIAYCWPSCGFGGVEGVPSGLVQFEPIRFEGELRFGQVSAGTGHSCGVATDGRAYCWGSNFFGQFGDGTIDTEGPRGPSPVAGDLLFKEVTAGSGHTCGVTTDGVAYCWGLNEAGQLGDGTTDRRLTPTPVAGGLRFAELSAGDFHSCGVTTDGVGYCWGHNGAQFGDGRLGDGTTVDRLTPTPVAGGLRFALVSAGSSHTCGVTTDHVAYCWGFNGGGQLGYGTPTPSWDPYLSGRRVPTQVANP